jgi:starvation-inducible DNA-binding protein
VTASLAAFGDSARKAIDEAAAFGDQDTSDVFTEVSRGIDKQLWAGRVTPQALESGSIAAL